MGLAAKVPETAKKKGDLKLFKPHHIPKFSIGLLRFLTTPLLVYFTVVGNSMMFMAAYVFYYFEKDVNAQVDSYSDALWWAICTVSTVGYGDIVPMTGFGRIIGAGLIIFGVVFFLGFAAVLASLMATFIVEEQQKSK